MSARLKDYEPATDAHPRGPSGTALLTGVTQASAAVYLTPNAPK